MLFLSRWTPICFVNYLVRAAVRVTVSAAAVVVVVVRDDEIVRRGTLSQAHSSIRRESRKGRLEVMLEKGLALSMGYEIYGEGGMQM